MEDIKKELDDLGYADVEEILYDDIIKLKACTSCSACYSGCQSCQPGNRYGISE